MGYKIIFSPQALEDLDAAVRFIARDNPAVAAGIGNKLIDKVAILENFPLIGSQYLKKNGCPLSRLPSLHHFRSPQT